MPNSLVERRAHWRSRKQSLMHAQNVELRAGRAKALGGRAISAAYCSGRRIQDSCRGL